MLGLLMCSVHPRGDTSTHLTDEPSWGDPRVLPKAVWWLGSVRFLPLESVRDGNGGSTSRELGADGSDGGSQSVGLTPQAQPSAVEWLFCTHVAIRSPSVPHG